MLKSDVLTTGDQISTLQDFFNTTVPFIKHPEVKTWAETLSVQLSSLIRFDLAGF